MKKMLIALGALLFGSTIVCASAVPTRVLELPPGKGNSRNSEGDFAVLKNGNILFVYSRYAKGTGHDHDPASLCSRVSTDGGKTWSQEDVLVVPNEGGMNVMSVSMLRLTDGSLALFYARKNSLNDCRPIMRVSRDEGKTWSAPTQIISDSKAAYYVINNARAIRLKSGRIVLPLAKHMNRNKKFERHAEIVCYCSDDDGKTWKQAHAPFKTFDEKGVRVVTQEPGVVELKDGRILMYVRTYHGRQWFYYSSDGCATWTKGEPSGLWSPASPATIVRLSNGDLLAVWNDHKDRPDLRKMGPRWANGLRTPLTLAISKDEGKTWINHCKLEGNLKGWYCYFAVCELNGNLLLGYCAMAELRHSRITTVPLSWLYESTTAREQAFFND